MEENLKQLLIIDLCARLPYGVKFTSFSEDMKHHSEPTTLRQIFYNEKYDANIIEGDNNISSIIDFVKPYLRPMSSMTEEERLELSMLTNDKFKFYLYTRKPEIICYEKYSYLEGLKVLDWLNAHHFDYRGLISMGLAIVAPEGMY